ncbi:hypothetical protein [Deinococcus knuensis]|uniref:DUF11 domain-containing protein n=1 Tax=Deinococcus knuensis TaxID=1837380 RepID=A0ABQ2SLA5_9DEIO|nr:hypothetical protein [Deinococcus knuensis]GGS33427.1 DUF11 domain-containing protein [Deinococcus knuensis]
MQHTPRILALLAALAAGSAHAAGTLAGTTITNTATAEFPDPRDTATQLSSASNTVSTVVLPRPDFDVTYLSGATDGGTQTVLGTTTVVTANAVPGQVITTDYALLNNGNVTLDIILNADTTGSDPGSTVQYYLVNPDGSRGSEIPLGSAVTVPADNPATSGTDEGRVRIVQVITLPTSPSQINKDSVFGASPEGTVLGTAGADPLVTPGNGYASGTTNQEESKTVDTDLQFTRVTVYTPSLDNTANGGATTPVDSVGTPISNPALLPPISSVTVPTVTAGTADTPDPVLPSSGYVTPGTPTTDPTPGGTPIARISGDEQIAYPQADTNTTADTVVFTNTLSNGGILEDRVQLFPALADGTADPAYTFDAATGTFTNTTTGVTVRFLDPVTGSVILPSTDPTDPTVATYPTLIVPSGTQSVYRTEVTFPDPDDSAAIPSYSVLIGADSLNDADLTSNNSTRDTVVPPAAQFGDTTPTLGAVATPTPVQTVDPSGAATDGSSSVSTDATAAFPMDVVNNGQYNDSYALSGSVTVTDAVTGATTTLPIQYYAADGTTLLPRLNTNPASPDYNTFITPVLAAGSESTFVAAVTIPAGTQAADYTVTQTATGNYSQTSVTDPNDLIRVTPTGNVAVAKFAAKTGVTAGSDPRNGIDNPAGYTATGLTGARTQEDIAYRIIAKNNYNTPVPLFLRDTVPTNTTLKSFSVNPLPTRTIYRVGGNTGTWTATPPAAGLPAGTIIDIAPDTDSNNLPDPVAPGTTLTADFVVTVQ